MTHKKNLDYETAAEGR